MSAPKLTEAELDGQCSSVPATSFVATSYEQMAGRIERKPKLTRITLDEAKQILATEPEGTERYALANTIVSLYAANQVLMTVAQETEANLEFCREALR